MNKALQNVLVPVAAASAFFAGGVATHDHLPFVSSPYELSQQDPMLDGLASGSARDGMDIQARVLANAILTHIPEGTDCSNSCVIEPMDRVEPASDTKQSKYEILWMGSDVGFVEVIATELSVSKPTINAYGNKVYDTGNGSGVSVLFWLRSNALNTLKAKEASNAPILANDFRAAINDPDTIASSEFVHNDKKYAVAHADTVEWGELGPKNVKSVSENDIEYPARLNEVLNDGFAAFASVEAAERGYPQTAQ